MLQGPGAGDLNAQLMSSGAIASGLVQPPSAPTQVQLPNSSYCNGDQADIPTAANREGLLNTHPLLNPNMVMSVLPRSLPGPLPQMAQGIPQTEMAFSMPTLSGGMPQILLPNLTVRPLGTSSESPLTANGLPLMNVNISSSNFLKAINFDAASNRATTGCGSKIQARGDQDGDNSWYSQSEDGNLMEQSTVSEPNVDLIEQQQATAQAQLLDRFKQLRQWQASQQKMLMKQQQEQLAMLREEQSRVQMLIVKQRENQWGASGVINHATNSQLKSPTKKPPYSSQSTLPHAIAQSTLAMAKLNRQGATLRDEASQQPNTPPVVKGRPVPNIASGPSTPSEYLEHGNPNLDSDSNTVTSGTPLEDGIQRLADTASECSEAPGAGATYFHSKSEVSEEEKQQRENSGKKYGPPIPFPLVDEEHQKGRRLFENEMLSNLNNSGPGQHTVGSLPLQNTGQMTFAQYQNYSMNPSQIINGGQSQSCHDHAENAENHVLDFRDFCHAAQNDDLCVGDDQIKYDDDDEQEEDNDEQSKYDHEEYQIDEDNYDEEQSEFIQQKELIQNEKEQENNQNYETINPEDKPVVGAKKSFEELLEEELQKEEARQSSGTNAAQQQSSEMKGSQKKAFLRRREGLARFGVHTKKSPQRKPTLKLSIPIETRSSKSTENSTKPSNKKTSTALSSTKKEHVQSQTSASNVKTSLPSKTSTSNTASVPSVSKTTAAVASQVCAPTKGMVSYKASKLHLNVPTAGKTTSPQKPQNSVMDLTAKSANMVMTESKPSDSTGEVSFQRCMQDHAKYEEIESEELQEFEILEQFADDNASFLSNVSVVNKVLSEEKKSKSSQSGQSSRSTQSATAQLTAAPNVTNGQHDELSSGEDSESEDELNSTLRESPVEFGHHPMLQRKVSQLEHRSPSKGKILNQGDDSDVWEEFEQKDGQQITGNDSDDSNQSESSSSEGESDTDTDDNFDIKDIILHSKFDDRCRRKSKMTDDKSCSMVQPNHIKSQNFKDEEISKDITSHDDEVVVSSQNTADDFNDDEEWRDLDEVRAQGPALHPSSNNSGPIVKTTVFPDQNGVEEPDVSTTPPTSKLVTKLFPKLKPEKPKCSPITIEQQEQFSNVKQVPLGDGIQSKALRDKLMELEREIERFRKENASLEALRKKREEGLDHLKKEMAEFEKQKAAELQRLQEYKNEEIKKLKKERRVFEQYQKASNGKPDKKVREEIESLKKQLKELQDELKHKEQRWTASTSRLRDRLEYIEHENAELKEEIKVLEKKRLEIWHHKEAALPAKIDKKQDTHSASGVHHCISGQQPSEGTDQLPASQVVTAFSESQGSRPLHHSHVNKNASVIVGCDKSRSDTVSELPDSTSQALADLNITNDESLIMQTVPQAMSRGPAIKHHSSSPVQTVISVPTAVTSSENRVNVPRKTAVAVNISQTVDKGDEEYEELQHADGKIERIYSNGAREILFSNGTRKQVSADGQSIIVSFFNGDIKQILPDQRVVYYYADARTTHTTYPDGLEIIQFPNNQIEKNYPDGTREITFPDQTIKYLFPTGVEESIFPDGTVIRIERNGDKVMEFPNGQREIHTPQYKRREYPDGTVKTVYPDGRQETRYSSGRIRVKDKDGQVIIDRRL